MLSSCRTIAYFINLEGSSQYSPTSSTPPECQNSDLSPAEKQNINFIFLTLINIVLTELKTNLQEFL